MAKLWPMTKDLAENKKLVPISEAAEFLGVSIDTVRRWDKQGILHSERAADQTRYFSLEELEKVKFNEPLSISAAAQQLGISATTLRRLEEKGVIKPDRNEAGERIYSKESLEKFLKSEYFLRQKKVEEKILEPPAQEPKDKKGKGKENGAPRESEADHKVLGTVLTEHEEHIDKLLIFRRAFYFAGLILATGFVLMVILITALFIMFPESTAKFFGYYRPKVNNAQALVLGAKYPADSEKIEGTVLGKALKPFSRVSLGVVKQINPEVYEKIVPKRPIEDVNDILSINEDGAVFPFYNFTFPDTSYLKIPDTELITNLNADYIRGKVPGTGEGNLVVFGKNSTIEGLNVNGGNIINNSVSSADLAEGSVTTTEILDSTIQAIDLADNSVTSAKILDGTIVNADIADSAAISDKKLAQITSGDKVAGSAVQLNSTGGLVNSSGLSLSRSCSNSQVLAWNSSNSTWECSTSSGGGGSGDITSVTAGSGLTGGGTSGDVTLNVGAGSGITVNSDDVAVNLTTSGTTGSTSSNSGLEVSSSGLTLLKGCDDNRILKYTDAGGWACATDATGGGGGSSVWSDLTDPTANLSLAMAENTTAFTWNTAATAGLTDAFTLAITNDATTDSATQRLLVLKNNSASGGTTDTLLAVENADDSTVTTGIQIVSSSTGSITTALDVSDTEIVDAINVGANRIVGTTPTIDFTNFDVSSGGTVTIADGQAYTGVNAVTFSSGAGLTIDAGSNTITIASSDTAISATGLATFTTATSLSLNPTSGTTYTLGSSATTANLFNSTTTTLNIGGAATTLELGANTGTTTVNNDFVVEDTTDLQGNVSNSTGNLVLADTVDIGSATTGINVTTAGVITDSNGNVVIADTVDLGSATTGINVTTAGVITDSDGNVVISDTVDLGSASTGINVTTAGVISDIDGNLVLNDQTDIGSTTTGIRVTTAGSISDIDGTLQLNDALDVTGTISDSDSNLVLADTVDIGSATTGINVTTAGLISDIDGNVVISDVVDLGSATNGINITSTGLITDNDGNVVIADTVDLGSATTGINITTAGVITDSDGNVVISDTVDLGSTTTGLRVDTSGNVADIDGNVIINDQTDIGSPATGIRVATTGSISDIDGSIILDDQTDIGSTTTGIRVTTAGSISDIDGTLQLNDTLDVTGTISDSDSNLVLADTVDIGSSTTGLRVDTDGNVLDINGNIVLNDTVDIGSATTGLNVTTAGEITDTNGNVVISDVVDLGSSTTGLNVDVDGVITDTDGNVIISDTVSLGSFSSGLTVSTSGVVSDADANIVLNDQTDIGSATTGVRIGTDGSVSDIDGTLQLNDALDVTGTISDSNSNLVLADTVDIGSATTGLRVATDGTVFDIDGTFLVTDSGGTTLISTTATSTSVNLSAGSTFLQRICHNGLEGSAGVEEIGDCETLGQLDFAEYYGTDGSLEAGDVVSIDGEAQPYEQENIGHVSKAWVKAANTPYDQKIIGVISTNPYPEILGEGVFSEDEHPMPVALSGRVPVKISAENGPISVGDPLTSSSTAGVAMKATGVGPVLGKALQSYEGSGVGKIEVFVNISYYNLADGLVLGTTESPDIANSVQDAQSPDVTINLTDDGKFLIKDPQAATESAAVAFDRSGNATFAGTLTADKVRANQIIGLEFLTDKIDEPDVALPGIDEIKQLITQEVSSQLAGSQFTVDSSQSEATSSAQLADQTNQSIDSLDELLTTTDLQLDTLQVTGLSSLAQTQVAGTFSQDGTLIIDYGRQINVLGGALYFQNDGLAGDATGIIVDIGSGQASFDNSGSLKLAGTLTTAGLVLSDKSAGSGTISTGQTSVTVSTSAVSDKTKVVITFNSDYAPATRYFVTDKKAGEGFTVKLDLPTAGDAGFDWLLVNTN